MAALADLQTFFNRHALLGFIRISPDGQLSVRGLPVDGAPVVSQDKDYKHVHFNLSNGQGQIEVHIPRDKTKPILMTTTASDGTKQQFQYDSKGNWVNLDGQFAAAAPGQSRAEAAAQTDTRLAAYLARIAQDRAGIATGTTGPDYRAGDAPIAPPRLDQLQRMFPGATVTPDTDNSGGFTISAKIPGRNWTFHVGPDGRKTESRTTFDSPQTVMMGGQKVEGVLSRDIDFVNHTITLHLQDKSTRVFNNPRLENHRNLPEHPYRHRSEVPAGPPTLQDLQRRFRGATVTETPSDRGGGFDISHKFRGGNESFHVGPDGRKTESHTTFDSHPRTLQIGGKEVDDQGQPTGDPRVNHRAVAGVTGIDIDYLHNKITVHTATGDRSFINPGLERHRNLPEHPYRHRSDVPAASQHYKTYSADFGAQRLPKSPQIRAGASRSRLRSRASNITLRIGPDGLMTTRHDDFVGTPRTLRIRARTVDDQGKPKASPPATHPGQVEGVQSRDIDFANHRIALHLQAGSTRYFDVPALADHRNISRGILRIIRIGATHGIGMGGTCGFTRAGTRRRWYG